MLRETGINSFFKPIAQHIKMCLLVLCLLFHATFKGLIFNASVFCVGNDKIYYLTLGFQVNFSIWFRLKGWPVILLWPPSTATLWTLTSKLVAIKYRFSFLHSFSRFALWHVFLFFQPSKCKRDMKTNLGPWVALTVRFKDAGSKTSKMDPITKRAFWWRLWNCV